MELTDQIWKQLGFTKRKCNGGYDRWYHNAYLGDFIFYKSGASVSQGYLTFDFTDNRKQNPKTLKELNELLTTALKDSSFKQGVESNQQQIRSTLGIE